MEDGMAGFTACFNLRDNCRFARNHDEFLAVNPIDGCDCRIGGYSCDVALSRIEHKTLRDRAVLTDADLEIESASRFGLPSPPG